VRSALVYSIRIDLHTAGHSNTLESPIMLLALTWFLVVALLAIWSLAAWALHAVAVWTVSNAGALSGAASGASTMALPDWLAGWVPPDVAQWASQALGSVAPFIDSLLQAAPALAGGVTVAAWLVWGIGSGLLVLLGAGLHLLVSRLRRPGGGRSGPSAGPLPAAG
jgi:hypothetical protein